MKDFKKYILSQFIGKRWHLHCDCLIPLDLKGTVKDTEFRDNEILFHIRRDGDGKIVTIGSNHPNMKIEEMG